jgi:2-C-methyl-D-erythritol 2,4-cyclodiphosphate synthase
MIRTGIGYDTHKLVKGNSLIVGGIPIPSNFKSVGHSDGDSLIHAIIDSILGAANLGDIGQHFPSDDKALKGSPSSYFLKKIVQKLVRKNLQIVNVDSTIILQKPMVGPHIIKIKKNLSALMDINEDKISVKATTTDGLGFIGISEGWSALAISTLTKTY